MPTPAATPTVSPSPAATATPSPAPLGLTDEPCACPASTQQATCLPLSQADLGQLLELYVAERHISSRDVAGLAGHCGGTLISTGAQWATASFAPSPRAPLNVAVGFQDGADTGIYRRDPGGSWQFVTVGGEAFACAGGSRLPAAIRTLWHVAPCG